MTAEMTAWNVIAIGFFGLFFGSVETVTNSVYMVTKNLEFPRKQHGAELPAGVSDKDVKMKVYQMFALGLVLLTAAVAALAIDPRLFVAGGLAILASALVDFKKYRMTKMLAVWSTVAALAVVLSVL